MHDADDERMYHVVVRTLEKGLGNIEVFKETKPYIVGSKRRVNEVVDRYLGDPTVQVRVESNNVIVAIGIYGNLLWLSKVPPPKYWLQGKRPEPTQKPERPERTGNERMAACGLPIPERYRVQPCQA